MSRQGIRISEVAKRAGVSVATLRFYERRRLIPPPDRDENNNYRAYDEAALERIASVKRMQNLGFSLKEIRRVLEASKNPKKLLELATAKLVEVEQEATRVLKAKSDLSKATQGQDAASKVRKLLIG